MGTIRVMSWNIRTLGSHNPSDYNYQRMIEIIINSKADIVCIQELMIGRDTVRVIGSPISRSSIAIINHMSELLNQVDTGGSWVYDISGVNSGSDTRMRDAYAFLIRRTPSKSKFNNGDPVDSIIPIMPPAILRQEGHDYFPSRRPGMITCQVKSGSITIPINIISYHAATPTNSFKGSGNGINKLATLKEIGGSKMVNGMQKVVDSGNPLPQIDTIILGDFNYSTDVSGAIQVYNNLITNYHPCINDPRSSGKPRYTTYSSDGTIPFRNVSAYDNIFYLLAHKKFTPAIKYNGSSAVIDFILEAAKALGVAAEFNYYPTETAWYVVYIDTYAKQHGINGISDHLPVWADFTIVNNGAAPTALRILPTAGFNNNCMIHAMLGVLHNGLFYSHNAPELRINFLRMLQNYSDTTYSFPNDSVRNGIIGAMIVFFEGNNNYTTFLQRLIGNTINPFKTSFFWSNKDLADFTLLYVRYVNQLQNRMLYVQELEAIAFINNIRVELYVLNGGQYFHSTYNAGGATPVTIFHQGVHFSRFNAA